eukprot:3473752-Rhodomonas_salina.1
MVRNRSSKSVASQKSRSEKPSASMRRSCARASERRFAKLASSVTCAKLRACFCACQCAYCALFA